MGKWINGWLDGWIDGWVDKQMNRWWVGRYIDKQINEWMDRWREIQPKTSRQINTENSASNLKLLTTRNSFSAGLMK